MIANPTLTDGSTQLRREWALILLFTLIAAVLRFTGFGKLGLTHFDEGIYASAGTWSLSPGGLASIDPGLIPYAPPGYPILIGLGDALLGVSDVPALLVTIACGVLTVPVAGWLGRRTFGPGAGAAAAAFAALATAHVAFSRKALTDAPFLLTWLIALGLGGRFLERPRLGRALAFGIAVGISQNFKYNGWLAGAIVILAAITGLIVNREERRPAALARTFGLGLLAALAAAAFYWPWYRFVETHGGYSDLIRHHRSYLGEPGTWLPYWKLQLAQVIALSGGIERGVTSWSAAWLGAGLAVNGLRLALTKSRWDMARLRIGWLLGTSLLAALPDLPWWVGLAWFPFLLFDKQPALRVLAVWWLVFSVMTPCYHPYARLWLPLHGAGWIGMAGMIVRLGPFSEPGWNLPTLADFRRPHLLAQTLAVLACLAASHLHWGNEPPRPFPGWLLSTPTDALRDAVAQLPTASPLGSTPDAKLRVFARRPVLFYLALQGKYPFRILPDSQEILGDPGPSGDWALIDEAQLGQSTEEGAASKAIAGHWIRRFGRKTPLDPVTLLDVNPDASFASFLIREPEIVLFSPRPPGRSILPSTPPRNAPDGP